MTILTHLELEHFFIELFHYAVRDTNKYNALCIQFFILAQRASLSTVKHPQRMKKFNH